MGHAANHSNLELILTYFPRLMGNQQDETDIKKKVWKSVCVVGYAAL